MAFKFLIIVSLVAAANAGFVWVEDDEDDHAFPSFHHKIPNYYIPRPPPLPHFGYFPMPFLPNIPTVDDIRKAKPGRDQVYNGVAVRSSSGFKRDKDGKLVKTGGSAILVNTDGSVEEAKFGKNPPKIDDPIVIPTIPDFPSFHHHAPIPPIPPIPPIAPIPPIPPINLHHKPGKNEHFVGFSTSSFSHSSDVNGVKSSGGGKNTVVNVDGEVDAETVQYDQHDKV